MVSSVSQKDLKNYISKVHEIANTFDRKIIFINF
jgi:hypothetical protein